MKNVVWIMLLTKIYFRMDSRFSKYCQKHGLSYPELDDEGNIADSASPTIMKKIDSDN